MIADITCSPCCQPWPLASHPLASQTSTSQVAQAAPYPCATPTWHRSGIQVPSSSTILPLQPSLHKLCSLSGLAVFSPHGILATTLHNIRCSVWVHISVFAPNNDPSPLLNFLVSSYSLQVCHLFHVWMDTCFTFLPRWGGGGLTYSDYNICQCRHRSLMFITLMIRPAQDLV